MKHPRHDEECATWGPGPQACDCGLAAVREALAVAIMELDILNLPGTANVCRDALALLGEKP